MAHYADPIWVWLSNKIPTITTRAAPPDCLPDILALEPDIRARLTYNERRPAAVQVGGTAAAPELVVAPTDYSLTAASRRIWQQNRSVLSETVVIPQGYAPPLGTAVIPVLPDGQVVWFRRSQAVDIHQGGWGVVHEGVVLHESYDDAARRSMVEEAGLTEFDLVPLGWGVETEFLQVAAIYAAFLPATDWRAAWGTAHDAWESDKAVLLPLTKVPPVMPFLASILEDKGDELEALIRKRGGVRAAS